jgi:hypothetical protein
MFGMLKCFPPDSARTKNPVATMTATQNISLAAFGIFILLVLFCAPAFRFFVESQLTLCGSVRTMLRRQPGTRQAESLNG